MASILPTSPSMSHLSPASNEMPKASITQEIIPATERAHWTRHLPALDGVRALAILLVMAHNFNLLENTKSVAGKANELLFNLGWVGVQLFFVLSGFLITNILLSTKGSSNYFASFFGRRALRIFPLYYLALAGGLIVYPLLSGTSIEGAENQVWLWSYLSNWAAPMGQDVGLYPHMWSLAVEEQFYLLWPFLVYFLSRRGLMRVCLALTAIALVSRIGIRVMDMSPEAAYQFTICRIDAIALGGVAAMLFRDLNIVSLFAQKRTLIRITLVVAAVLTFVVTKGAPRIGLLSQTIGYSLWAIIAAIWVYDVATSDPRGKLVRALSWQPLRKVGAYSYAMYVFHKPLHQLVGHPFVDGYYQAGAVSPLFNLLYFIALSGAVFFLAYVSFHVFEKQFLPLKRYFVASHKSK